MKNILVPVGSVDSGISNLRYAVELAKLMEAKIYLINIYKEFSKVGGLTKVNQLLIDDSEEILENILSKVDTEGVEVISRPIKGDPFEAIQRVAKMVDIDLIILSPQSLEIQNEVYLGSVTGKIVKQSDIPVLVVPRAYPFARIENILLAVKSGQIEREGVLDPLKEIAELFNAEINLLHVKTPDAPEEAGAINKELQALKSSLTETENATIFQGVLEHFQSHNPDMLCVLRRKRGFFKKLWEKNSVMKKEFHTSKPLLILKGQD